MPEKSKEIITPKGNKIKVTYHDKFFYTDALGTRKEIEGKELFSDLFDATEIIKDVERLIQMHIFYTQGLWVLEPLLRAKSCMDNIFWIEHKLYNMNFVFNLSGVFDDKNRKKLEQCFKTVYIDKPYEPIYSEEDHKYILDLHIEIATKQDNWKLYLSLKEQYLEKVSTLLQFAPAQIAKEKFYTEPLPTSISGRVFNPKVEYSLDESIKSFEWLADPNNARQDVPVELIIMMSNRSLFRTRFNRWFEDMHSPPAPIDNTWLTSDIPSYTPRGISIERHYRMLENALHNNPVKITDLPSSRFDYARPDKTFNLLFYNLLFNKFKYWFDRKNEEGLVVKWQDIGTKDSKMPHIILLDKNFENRIAEQNRQDKLLEVRVAEMEVEHFKDMSIDEAMKWVQEVHPIGDDIEII